ncbi:uncharacterized protein [Miscanthus floridulus]|uniref:uncharacterized protein n=1 Tax=Miscanthus floridulus TaxID=154761 RepID=UPI0034595B91
MASATTEQRASLIVDGEEDEQQQQQQIDDLVGRAAVVAREVSKRVSPLAVEGGGGFANGKAAARRQGVLDIGRGGVARPAGNGHDHEADAGAGAPRLRRSFTAGARTLPPPHAWLAIEDTRKQQKQEQQQEHDDSDEQWTWLFRGGGAQHHHRQQQQIQRRSSFSVVRRERAAREAWLDRAWEMKRSWHQRNGGAPDADTPVVVVVGTSPRASSSSSHYSGQQHQGMASGGGVAMDVEEVRACRDLGLELPSDCTVEIQCYGLSGGSSPTHCTTPGSGADSPCALSSPPGGGADPMDVKARLKVWAQAVALASTTHLTS